MSLLTFQTISSVGLTEEAAQALWRSLGDALGYPRCLNPACASKKNVPELAATIHVEIKLNVISPVIIPGDNIAITCALVSQNVSAALSRATPPPHREMIDQTSRPVDLNLKRPVNQFTGFPEGNICLPKGWGGDYTRVPAGGYCVYSNPGEQLVVQKSVVGGGGWFLLHYGANTGHRFDSAQEAIEHAHDAIMHGH